MTMDDFDNVLSLMVAIIFADKLVFDSEIKTFIQSVSQLDFKRDFSHDLPKKLTISPSLSIDGPPPDKNAGKNDCRFKDRLSPSQLSKWFETNKTHIREQLSTPFYKDWFYSILNQLSHLPNKEKIVSVMHQISIADGRVHISERTLITLAERHWGMR